MALPATAAPLILAHNVFDWVHQYPGATLFGSNEAVGSEYRKVANYRRDRDQWQALTDSGSGSFFHYVRVDLGAGNLAAADYAFIDRGHNLWGRAVAAYGSLDNITYDRVVRDDVVPANPGLGVGAGDPTTGWAVTEEGALYTLAPAATATARYWGISLGGAASFIPIIPGIQIGLRHQLAVYSSELDEDAGDRIAPTEQSTMGMLAQGRTVSWRKISLNLSLIGDTEYDTTIRGLRRLLFDKGVPFVAFANYGRWPYRGWMYRYLQNSWSSRLRGAYRDAMITAREHDHRTYFP